MRVWVDRDLCSGCGCCAEWAPSVFELRDGISYVKADPVPPGAEKAVVMAVLECPGEVIYPETGYEGPLPSQELL